MSLDKELNQISDSIESIDSTIDVVDSDKDAILEDDIIKAQEKFQMKYSELINILEVDVLDQLQVCEGKLNAMGVILDKELEKKRGDLLLKSQFFIADIKHLIAMYKSDIELGKSGTNEDKVGDIKDHNPSTNTNEQWSDKSNSEMDNYSRAHKNNSKDIQIGSSFMDNALEQGLSQKSGKKLYTTVEGNNVIDNIVPGMKGSIGNKQNIDGDALQGVIGDLQDSDENLLDGNAFKSNLLDDIALNAVRSKTSREDGVVTAKFAGVQTQGGDVSAGIGKATETTQEERALQSSKTEEAKVDLEGLDEELGYFLEDYETLFTQNQLRRIPKSMTRMTSRQKDQVIGYLKDSAGNENKKNEAIKVFNDLYNAKVEAKKLINLGNL